MALVFSETVLVCESCGRNARGFLKVVTDVVLRDDPRVIEEAREGGGDRGMDG